MKQCKKYNCFKTRWENYVCICPKYFCNKKSFLFGLYRDFDLITAYVGEFVRNINKNTF